MSKNKHEGSGESTYSVDEGDVWAATMSDAPKFEAQFMAFSVNGSGEDASVQPRERAVVTPLSSLSPEERRRRIIQTKNPNMPGKLVARVYQDKETGEYDTVEDYDDRPTRTLRAADMKGDVSKISTNVGEAASHDAEGDAASQEGMNGMQRELMQAKVEAMKKEMEAIEKALGDEGKSPEQLKEERKQKFGKAALKVFVKTAEIVGGAAAGAAIPMLMNAIASAF